MKTKAVQVLINSVLPEDIRDYTRTYDKKSINDLMSLIADKYRDKYADIVNNLTDVGRHISYLSGETLTLDDFKPMFDKDSIIAQMKKEEAVIKSSIKNTKEKGKKIKELYGKYADLLEKLTMDAGKVRPNNLFNVVASGARGNASQLKMLVTAPAIYTDNKGDIIPLFIKKSFGEGLTLPEYLASTFGARSSVTSNKRATARAGGLGKEFNRIMAPLIINKIKDESYDGMGLDFSIDDDDIYGRVLARDAGGLKKGTVLDRNSISILKKNGVKKLLVKSPIASISEEGLASEAYGMDYDRRLPPVGASVGMTSSNATMEPVTQGALNAKHTSGAYKGKKAISGLDYIEQFVQSPETFKDKATVSTEDGKVTKIVPAPQGGQYIYINETPHYVLPDTDIDVKQGDTVEAGDIISDGLADPEDIVMYKGIGEGRRYYATRFKRLLDDSGTPAALRNTETIARNAIDTVRITSPEGMGQYLPEDIVSYNKIEANYTPRENSKEISLKNDKGTDIIGKYLERPVLHYTIGTRVTPSMVKRLKDVELNNILINDEPPGFEPIVVRLREAAMKGNEDWLSRMNASYIKSNIIEAATKGMDTNIRKNINPYSRIGQGYDFGKNIEEGKF